jgi:hypothetical protein
LVEIDADADDDDDDLTNELHDVSNWINRADDAKSSRSNLSFG